MAETVLITGANRGIGLALCRFFQARGDKVVAACRSPSVELQSLGVKVIDNIDVVEQQSIDKLVESLHGKTIDILINNAGILRSSSLGSLDYDDVLEQFQVNAIAPLRVVESLLGHLKAGSKVAMITSRMGSIDDNTSGGSYGYRMSKAALNAASKSLAVDLKNKGIAVALIHPGYVQTEMVNFGGDISAELAASRIASRIADLSLDSSGSFWHSNGELLPW
jgi:NAD(P)-dependent dehydrogenase (short-subunit alcohol dehydrogenase family)